MAEPAMGALSREAQEPLAIICGGGTLPYAVADAVLARGRQVALFAIVGAADAERVRNYPHRWIAVGQAEKLYAGLRQAGCRQVVRSAR